MNAAATVTIPPEVVEQIARRAAELVLQNIPSPPGPWLTTGEAAERLRCRPQRVFNLVSEGRLRVYKDGSRNLFRASELDEMLLGTPTTGACAAGSKASS